MLKENFEFEAKKIHEKHRSQSTEDILNLNEKYKKILVFEKKVNIWDALKELAFVNDPTDKKLYAVSQWVHTLQVVEGMEKNKITDEQLIMAAWIHDLGKILLKVEDPSNVVCDNFVIEGKQNSGLDNCKVTWNHDEWVYLKFKNIISKEMAWLIRYHSINIKNCEPYFNQKDREYVEKYLKIFNKYDKGTKSIYNFPKIDFEKHKRILEKFFPEDLEL